MNFSDFCNAVDASPLLWEAPLVKTEVYKTKIIAAHRCLVVDICLGNDGHMCLRLDRQFISYPALIAGGGTTASNDIITVARRIPDLKLENFELVNIQIFPSSPPTLRTFVRVLRTFSSQAKKYTLLSKNCWFLCSIVEDALASEADGLYAAGEPQKYLAGLQSRVQILSILKDHSEGKEIPIVVSSIQDLPSENSRQSGVAFPFFSFDPSSSSRCSHQSPPELCAMNIALYLRDYIHISGVSADEVPALSRMLKKECLIMLRHSYRDGGRGYANKKIVDHLLKFAELLWRSNSLEKAAEVTRQASDMMHVLQRRPSTPSSSPLPGPNHPSDSLAPLNIDYNWDSVYNAACVYYAEAVRLYQTFREPNSHEQHVKLALTLYNIGLALDSAGLYLAECGSSISQATNLHRKKLEDHASNLIERLKTYKESLSDLGVPDAVPGASTDSLALISKLHHESLNANIVDLDLYLEQYSASVGKHRLDYEAWSTLADSISLTRTLSQEAARILASKLLGGSTHPAIDFCLTSELVTGVVNSEYLREQALGTRGDQAVALCNLIQKHLDESRLFPALHARHEITLKLLQDICSSSGELPQLGLEGVTVKSVPFAVGGEALIFEGEHEGRKVAVRTYLETSGGWQSEEGSKALKRIKREVIAHRQLNHPNIIKLLGTFKNPDVPQTPSLVLPYYSNKSAKSWMPRNKSPRKFVRIVGGATSGLHYLHTQNPPILHGDLHPDNILIDETGNAVLCDFGFSYIRHEVSRTLTIARASENYRFLAPEIGESLEESVDESPKVRPTQEADIYALSMTMFELGTATLPFSEFPIPPKRPHKALELAMEGKRPSKPVSFGQLEPEDFAQVWSLMEGMWVQDPEKRIRVDVVDLALSKLGSRIGVARVA